MPQRTRDLRRRAVRRSACLGRKARRHSSPRIRRPKSRRSPSRPPAVPGAWSRTLRSAMDPDSARHRISVLRCLSEAVDPGDRSRLHCSTRKISTKLDRSTCTGLRRKSSQNDPRLRATAIAEPKPQRARCRTKVNSFLTLLGQHHASATGLQQFRVPANQDRVPLLL